MPRKRREESPTCVYHWIVRGMNKKTLFHDSKDRHFFRNLVLEYKQKFAILIYHYCCMTNHVHMLVSAEKLENLSEFSHYVQRRYAYYYCGRYKWTGSVFQRSYRSLSIDRDEYLLECGRYIERNPLKAGLAKEPGEYTHTSYRYYALGETDELISASPAYLDLSDNQEERRRIYSEYVKQNRIQEEMTEKGLLPI